MVSSYGVLALCLFFSHTLSYLILLILVILCDIRITMTIL